MPGRGCLSRLAPLLALALGVAGCASDPAKGPGARADAAPAPPPVASSQALNSPMRSLDLTRHEVPAVLLQALLEPYADPRPRDCAKLGSEIQALDAVLGPDADVTPPRADRNDLGLRLLAGGVRSAIPYYGWVRRLSGAERRDREAFAAREAGTIRRAYLKGLGQGMACAVPAAPRPRT